MIGAGHSYNDVMDYTFDQVECFLEHIEEIEKEFWRMNVYSNTYGARADEKELKKFLKNLE